MKNAPSRLATFLIFITIARVAFFLANGLHLGWMGWAFAVGLGAGVYVSAYYFGKAAGWNKIVGFLGLILFGGGDLWFNEMEVIRILSAKDLIVDSANFMNYSADDLRWAMQYSAIFFGAFPTLGAGLLGWMQSVAEGIPDFQKPTLYARIETALGRMVTSWAGGFAVKLEKRANIAVQDGEIMPLLDGQAKLVRRWKSLTAEDIARIPLLNREEVTIQYGVSDGAAGDWHRKIKAGERPWL